MRRVNVRVENGGQQHAIEARVAGLAARDGLPDGIRLGGSRRVSCPSEAADAHGRER